jgi:hypothetical protein
MPRIHDQKKRLIKKDLLCFTLSDMILKPTLKAIPPVPLKALATV